ncbi:hypothetical protein OKW45_005694 [Paraburkholderia sp. WSM4175]
MIAVKQAKRASNDNHSCTQTFAFIPASRPMHRWMQGGITASLLDIFIGTNPDVDPACVKYGCSGTVDVTHMVVMPGGRSEPERGQLARGNGMQRITRRADRVEFARFGCLSGVQQQT